jgi:hypothetical protein
MNKSQSFRAIRSSLIALQCLGFLLVRAEETLGSDRQILHGHVPMAVPQLKLQALSRLPATNRLHLAIGLPLHNTNAMARLLDDM